MITTYNQAKRLKENKVIAEFMGGVYLRREAPFDKKIIEEIKFEKGNHPYISNTDYSITERIVHLRYHCDWSWLMPVVNNIILRGLSLRTFGMINEETNQVMVRFNGYPLHQADSLIESTYLAVVDYIENTPELLTYLEQKR